MRVIVDGTLRTVTVEETDNLKAISVVVRSADEDLAGKVLEHYGHLDGSHAWLNVNSLNSFAPLPRSCSWDERFAKMIDYARTQGWTDETGTFVRAHIEDSEA